MLCSSDRVGLKWCTNLYSGVVKYSVSAIANVQPTSRRTNQRAYTVSHFRSTSNHRVWRVATGPMPYNKMHAGSGKQMIH